MDVGGLWHLGRHPAGPDCAVRAEHVAMPWTLKMLRWQYHCYLMRQCLWHQSPKARMRRHLDDCCDAVPARSRRSYDRPQSLHSGHSGEKPERMLRVVRVNWKSQQAVIPFACSQAELKDRTGRRLDPWPSQPTDRSPIACPPFAPAQSLRPRGLAGWPSRVTAKWSEVIDGRSPPQGNGAKQPNKVEPRGGFSLRPIDRLKQSASMSVGDADNMPR